MYFYNNNATVFMHKYAAQIMNATLTCKDKYITADIIEQLFFVCNNASKLKRRTLFLQTLYDQ